MKPSSDEKLKSAVELDLLLDDFVLEKKNDYLKRLFEFPSGKWVEIKYFLILIITTQIIRIHIFPYAGCRILMEIMIQNV